MFFFAIVKRAPLRPPLLAVDHDITVLYWLQWLVILRSSIMSFLGQNVFQTLAIL